MALDPNSLQLNLRKGLPEVLQVLLREYPRSGWTGDPGYQGLIQFWLDRHMMFRQLTQRLGGETQKALDGNLDLNTYKRQLARLGSFFVQELHGHHNIEDQHYFPVLAKLDPRIQAGFDLLDQDHHALDPLLGEFAQDANAVLRAQDPSTSTALKDLNTNIIELTALLDRHLVDEEELVVPVILKHGAQGLA